MINRFTKWLKKQIGSIYVWGAQGEVFFNEDWIRKMETSDKNAERAITFYRKRLKEGAENVAAYDCSGLVVRFLLDNDIIESDVTSGGLYVMCNQINKTALSEGDLVFRHNGSSIHHVGVYVGNDMVIHAKGRDVGVVMEHIDANGDDYWNKFGRLPELETQKNNFPCLMTYSGATYSNLRNKPSATTGLVIDKVVHDEELLVLAIDTNSWADVVKYCKDSNTYKRGFCISKYLKRA